jgi:FAD/FMN-containing dehydrogenase
MPDLAERLVELCGARGVRRGEAVKALDPGFHKDNLSADLAVFPETTAMVAAVVALCRSEGVAIVPQGGRTGIAGGAATAPRSLILSLSRMQRILTLDPLARTALVEAGVTLGALQQAAAAHALVPGIDIGARDSATIGGMISTNAGGSEAFRYGTMRQRVLGLEAVLPDGTVLSDLTQVAKANEGYDVKQLLIGAEGTLGIVTRAVLRLSGSPANRVSALAACPSAAAALAALDRLQRRPGLALIAAEAMWRDHLVVTAKSNGLDALASFAEAPLYILFEAGGDDEDAVRAAFETALADAVEANEIVDVVIAANLAQRTDLWRLREDWAVDRAFPGGLWFDISVPLAALDATVAAMTRRVAAHDPRHRVFIIGHLADGNLHVTVNAPSPIRDVYDEVAPLIYTGLKEIGGSFSAEHGIGLEKRAALQRYGDPGKLALMRQIKHLLDPDGLMNPGKVLLP